MSRGTTFTTHSTTGGFLFLDGFSFGTSSIDSFLKRACITGHPRLSNFLSVSSHFLYALPRRWDRRDVSQDRHLRFLLFLLHLYYRYTQRRASFTYFYSAIDRTWNKALVRERTGTLKGRGCLQIYPVCLVYFLHPFSDSESGGPFFCLLAGFTVFWCCLFTHHHPFIPSSHSWDI
ncbi:hypothetical protein VTK26DRAFT_7811 [Humicola hyalothermophila]